MADAIFAGIQVAMILAVWSYLYRENIFSKVASSIVISISTVHFFLVYVQRTYEFAVIPLLNGRISYIIPLTLGLLMYTRLSKKWAWLSSYAYSLQIGLGTGSTLTTVIASSITGRIAMLINEPFKGATMFDKLSGTFLFIGAILSITYWLFTKEATGVYGYAVKIGRLFLMASIGMLYAEDVLWSQSLFVGAWEMIIDNFIKAVLLGIPVA
ncbi:hypothetical protein ES703_98637 [subsurface metagenome]